MLDRAQHSGLPLQLSTRLRVYVVDDEEIIAFTLRLILQNNGFDASSFTDPAEALERIVSVPPDVLISDILMPHISGVELAMRVTTLCPTCEILLFSAQTWIHDELLLDAQKRGFHFRLLEKPIHPLRLLQEIRQLTH